MFCSVLALSLHGTCLSVVFLYVRGMTWQSAVYDGLHAPNSTHHTPYRIWLTVNNLHITHVNSEHSHSPIQWPLCACNEFLCIWIKCCSTHMITEKSHSATAIKAAKNWIYSHSSAVFFSLSSHHSQMEMYTLNGAVPVFATFFFCLFFFIIRVLNFAHRFYCWIIL